MKARMTRKIMVASYEPVEFDFELTDQDRPGVSKADLEFEVYKEMIKWEMLHAVIQQDEAVDKMKKFRSIFADQPNGN